MGWLSMIFGESEEQKEARMEKERIQKVAEEKFNELYDQTENPIFDSKGNLFGNIDARHYRAVWRRAVVREAIFKKLKNEEESKIYHQVAKIAEDRYYFRAPTNKYGKVELQISEKQAVVMWKKEMNFLFPTEIKTKVKEYSCIYLGTDNIEKKPYIGQTVNEPELRQLQHRKNKTGPYKNGATYAKWEILKENVQVNELDYWESKFIGEYDSFENGHNDNIGNDRNAYEEGKANH